MQQPLQTLQIKEALRDYSQSNFQAVQTNLSIKLLLGTLQVLDQQVLAGELVVVGEVVDPLPVVEVHLVKLMMDPPGKW